jgi:hypothetical protein
MGDKNAKRGGIFVLGLGPRLVIGGLALRAQALYRVAMVCGGAMKQFFAVMTLAFGLAMPVGAQGDDAQGDPLLARQLGDALMMDQTLAIMQREAQKNAVDIAPDLFGGTVPSEWTATISTLFDPARSRAEFDAGMGRAISVPAAQELTKAAAYFAAPFGRQILKQELDARAALLDADIEAAALQSWVQMQSSPMPASAQRAALIREVVAAGDLIESNVTAALNGNLAFYQGLAEAGGFAAEMTPDDMLAEVRAQEAQLRADTEDWLYPFLALAYAPLSDAQLLGYIDFMKSPEGAALSRVLVMAFDGLSALQSRGMGLAAGRLMTGQDI